MRVNNNERGSVLMMTLWVSIILSAFLLGFVSVTSYEVRIVQNSIDKLQASYLARAAMAKIFYELQSSTNKFIDTNDYKLDSDMVDIENEFGKEEDGESYKFDLGLEDAGVVLEEFREEGAKIPLNLYWDMNVYSHVKQLLFLLKVHPVYAEIYGAYPDLEGLADEILNWRKKYQGFFTLDELLLIEVHGVKPPQKIIKDLHDNWLTVWSHYPFYNINTMNRLTIEAVIWGTIERFDERDPPVRFEWPAERIAEAGGNSLTSAEEAMALGMELLLDKIMDQENWPLKKKGDEGEVTLYSLTEDFGLNSNYVNEVLNAGGTTDYEIHELHERFHCFYGDAFLIRVRGRVENARGGVSSSTIQAVVSTALPGDVAKEQSQPSRKEKFRVLYWREQ